MVRYLLAALSTTFLALFLMADTSRAAYPERTIIMVIPFSAGGNLDIVGRALVPSLEKELGVRVIIKNIGGAGGTLGAAELSMAAPDGYTIGYLAMGPLSLQPQIRELPYTTSSFKPVASVHNTQYVLMVRKDSPMNTLADAKKYLLEKDGEAIIGSSGHGGITHIASVAIVDALGGKAKHLPDKSSTEALKNLAGGVTDFYADPITILAAYDVKALGTFAAERHPDFPDVPTMKEQGYDLEFSSWGGIMVPRDTPDAVVEKLERAVRSAVNSPEFQEAARKTSTTVWDSGKEDFGAFITKQMVIDKGLIDKFNMKQ